MLFRGALITVFVLLYVWGDFQPREPIKSAAILIVMHSVSDTTDY
jgi:hypothetical protein